MSQVAGRRALGLKVIKKVEPGTRSIQPSRVKLYQRWHTLGSQRENMSKTRYGYSIGRTKHAGLLASGMKRFMHRTDHDLDHLHPNLPL